MRHNQEIILSGNKKAVICIHGFLGSPNQFEFLKPILLEKGFSVFSALLKGHGGTSRDFVQSNLSGYEESVQEIFETCKKDHDEIYFVTHSMGGLLALDQLSDEKVKGFFLMQMPFFVKLSVKGFALGFKKALNIKSKDPRFEEIDKVYGIEQVKFLDQLGYFPRFFDLFKKIDQTKEKQDVLDFLKGARSKVFAIYSKKDEYVRKKSSQYFHPNNTLILNSSGHFFYEKEEQEQIKKSLAEFLP